MTNVELSVKPPTITISSYNNPKAWLHLPLYASVITLQRTRLRVILLLVSLFYSV